jgi:hypothetical protein
MTEEEWRTCTNPSLMLAFLEGCRCGSDRKFRLFAVACCRRVWSGLRDERSRAAVEAAERFADGHATPGELRGAFTAAYVAVDDCLDFSQYSEDQAIAAYLSAARNINESATTIPDDEDANEIASHVWSYAIDGEFAASESQQTVLLRDIFGNPFRTVAFSPAWRTDTAIALAKQMYESRDFSAMPILADALQDAGCDSAANPLPSRGGNLLDHCRGPGPHVRGCWVADLVLDKQ